MEIIKQKKPEWMDGEVRMVGQEEVDKKNEEIAKTLETKQLPKGKEIKMKKDFYLYVGDTIFKVRFNGTDYRFTNLSTNKNYWIERGKEKILGREGEILVDESDTQASRKHLKVRVDKEGNLFLCDISKHGTYIEANKYDFDRLSLEEMKTFKNIKKSNYAEKFYTKDERYEPKYKIILNDGKILYVTYNLYTNELYEEIIGYIMNNGHLELRMFYKSQSEQARRSCPGVRNGGGLSKGEGIKNFSYETTTKVDASLGSIFSRVEVKEARDIDPILRYSREFGYNILQDDMIKETKVDALFSDSTAWDVIITEINRKISSGKLNKSETEEYMDLKRRVNEKIKVGEVFTSGMSTLCKYKDKTGKETKYRDIGSVSRMYENLIPKGLDYRHMMPLTYEKYKYKHNFLGNVKTNVYKCYWNGRLLKIYFSRAEDDESLVRIDNITDYEGKINSFGIQSKGINASPLIAKPVEYIKQTPYQNMPESVGNRFDKDGDGIYDYVDIRHLYQENPIIKHYKKLEGLL